MKEFLQQSSYLAVAVSLVSYGVGSWLKNRFKTGLLNPLLVSIVCTILFLFGTGITYETYNEGAKFLTWLLTPATVSLAIPLYEQWELLKNNAKAVMAGITAGVITSLLTVLLLSMALGLTHEEYVTLLPKSITTAIGMGVSEELGGYVTITVAVIVITGVIGNILGEFICKLFRIKEPISKGLALGTASHAIGTAKAMEIGEIEGAMSSLSIAVAGILTVLFATIFAGLL
ncbi:TIGR00659 family protein [Pseudobutyrivibrio sp. NOR37]|uniref:LrgB family protein n=1 Tax=Pseudobutyrivibrio xylanivorans TaxID=185007 RepID=A0A6M0LDF9_PSEXY|nr:MULTISPECIES: LrgB family protein [Pseudobutyrivibrio]NEX00604.1 LrgB family protein [Pseudobutyrivibrio xylanivorans]SFR61381.1 TIGR00659 family protein [Pseudobutyrivibrio sp. NOR37]